MHTLTPFHALTDSRSARAAGATVLAAVALAITTAYATERRAMDLDLSLEGIEPTITLQEHENRVVEEYSVNNNVYMLKVTPKAGGRPYYLVDPQGTGVMEWRRSSLGMDVQAPQWTLFSW